MLVVATVNIQTLAAIFGVAGHRLLSNLLCQVNRVVHNQIQGSPLADLTISTIRLRSGNVAGLANEAHSRPDIKTAPIVYRAGIPPVLSEGAAASHSEKLPGQINSGF